VSHSRQNLFAVKLNHALLIFLARTNVHGRGASATPSRSSIQSSFRNNLSTSGYELNRFVVTEVTPEAPAQR
jgi:hypothetical protein